MTLSITKPTVGASTDSWGTTNNTALDAIVTQINTTDATASAALVKASNLSDLVSASTARTNLGLVIGTNVQAYDATLSALAGLTIIDGSLPYGNGSDTFATTTLTATARSLLDDTSTSAMRTTLGVAIGSDVQAYSANLTGLASASANGISLVTAADYAAMRTLLSITSSHVNVTQLSSLSLVADRLPYANGTDTLSLCTFTAAGRALIDDADATAQRVTLGLVIGTNVQAYSANLTSLASATANGISLVQAADYAAMRTALSLGTAALAATGVSNSTDLPTRAQGDARYGAASIIIAVGDETTAITTGTAKVTFRTPCALTGVTVRASLATASSSGIPTVDINDGGVSILSTKLTIDAGELTSVTAATAAVVSDSSLADDAEITIDIDVAGTGAKGLKVVINGTRTY